MTSTARSTPADWRERAAIFLPLGVGIALPTALACLSVGLSDRVLGSLGSALDLLFVVYLPIYCVARALVRWAVLGEAFHRAFTRGVYFDWLPKSDAGRVGWPLLTTTLIALNLLAFARSWPWFELYAFDSSDPSHWARTVFVSLFIHADSGHLFGNLLWLWILGATLENRVSRRAFLGTYLAAGLAGKIVEFIWLFPEPFWSVGASGAISGLAGLFAVRLPFSRIFLSAFPFALPIPFAPTVSIPALALLATYFMRDVAGMLGAGEDFVGYGAHVGGYLCGVGAGYALGSWRHALAEWRRKRAIVATECDDGASQAALASLLERSPREAELLLERARRASRREPVPEAKRDYLEAIRLLQPRDRKRAAAVFAEFFRKFRVPLGAEEQLALTPSLVSIGEADLAAQGLEAHGRSLERGSELWAQLRFREGDVLLGMGLVEPASRIYQAVLEISARDPWGMLARRRMAHVPRVQREANRPRRLVFE